jgi:hypothetical protein
MSVLATTAPEISPKAGLSLTKSNKQSQPHLAMHNSALQPSNRLSNSAWQASARKAPSKQLSHPQLLFDSVKKSFVQEL